MNPLRLLSNNPNFANLIIEGLIRTLLWATMMYGVETYVSNFVRRFAATDHMYYVCATLFSALIFVLLRQPIASPHIDRPSTSNLLYDLREIYLYDCIVQVVGLVLYFSGVTSSIWMFMNTVIWLMKIYRFMWFAKNDSEFISWPAFGIVGFIDVFRKKKGVFSGTRQQRLSIYAAIASTLPLAAAVNYLIDLQLWMQVSAFPLALLVYCTFFYSRQLLEFRDHYMSVARRLSALVESNVALLAECTDTKESLAILKNGLSERQIAFVMMLESMPEAERRVLERALLASQVSEPPVATPRVQLVWENTGDEDDLQSRILNEIRASADGITVESLAIAVVCSEDVVSSVLMGLEEKNLIFCSDDYAWQATPVRTKIHVVK